MPARDFYHEQVNLGALLLKNDLARVMGFDPIKEEVTQWLN